MSASFHRQAREIFLEVCEHPEQERAALVAGRCPDTLLRREVESLIEHHDADATLAPVVADREVEARTTTPAAAARSLLAAFTDR